MKLKLVTFDIDLTQFLIDSNSVDDVIAKAIEINGNESLLGGLDNDLRPDVLDRHNYTVDDVDMSLLCGMMLRQDCCGIFDNVIVFTN